MRKILTHLLPISISWCGLPVAPKVMVGDLDPPAYSLVNIDIDTVGGRVAVPKSIIGYVNALELANLKGLNFRFGELSKFVIDKIKLQRFPRISSLLQGVSLTGHEPNIGPFPQYNIIVEDEPIEDVIDRLSKHKRHYKSGIRDELVAMLNNATADLIRITAHIENPRRKQMSSASGRLATAQSLLQAHEQFVENNPAPYQVITVHPESLTPEGGDAPVMPQLKSPFKILNLNNTMDTMTLEILDKAEDAMLETLRRYAKWADPSFGAAPGFFDNFKFPR